MEKLFVKFATLTAKIAGKPWTFIACLGIVLVWALSGPIFKFNETWQLVINTGTTIITFLMVFIIQNTQTRDTAALQIKLDELIRTTADANNALLDLEEMSEQDIERYHRLYGKLAKAAAEKEVSRSEPRRAVKP